MVPDMSMKIGQIKGIPIRLHFTLLVTFILISWTITTRFSPVIYPELATIEYWITGVMGAFILFFSVLLHELAHSLLAKKYGLNVREIILFIFGGVSNIEDLDIVGGQKETSRKALADFRKEIKIAVAGPITSFAIASILAITLFVLSQLNLRIDFAFNRILEIVLIYGSIVNVVLGIFNLIPAFPLDGGRILRAIIAYRKKNYEKGTMIAVRIGIIISYAFMATGFIIMFLGDIFAGVWILIIGWFLNNGAQSYKSQYELSSLLSGIKLRDIMNTNIIFMKESITINEALANYFNKYSKDSFPILDDRNRLMGIVTFKEARNIPENVRADTWVKEIMVPESDLILMQEDGSADEALMKMIKKPVKRIFVCDIDRRLLGLVSKTDIMNIASEKSQYLKIIKK